MDAEKGMRWGDQEDDPSMQHEPVTLDNRHLANRGNSIVHALSCDGCDEPDPFAISPIGTIRGDEVVWPENVREVRRGPGDAAVDMLAGPGWVLPRADAVSAGLVSPFVRRALSGQLPAKAVQ